MRTTGVWKQPEVAGSHVRRIRSLENHRGLGTARSRREPYQESKEPGKPQESGNSQKSQVAISGE